MHEGVLPQDNILHTNLSNIGCTRYIGETNDQYVSTWVTWDTSETAG